MSFIDTFSHVDYNAGMRGSNQGGKQPGAGRSAGSTERNRIALRALDPVERPKQDENRVTQRLRAVAALSARGQSTRKIAEVLGVSSTLISHLCAKPEYPALFREELDRAVGNPIATFAPMIPAATQAYEQGLAGEDAIPVAKDVFDRVYGKPLVRQQVDSRQRMEIVFIDATPLGGGSATGAEGLRMDGVPPVAKIEPLALDITHPNRVIDDDD